MHSIEKYLSGENLEIYRNIQDTIRFTQRKASFRNKRVSYEDIFPSLESAKNYYKESSVKSEKSSKSSTTSGWERNYLQEEIPSNTERSDFMNDETKQDLHANANRLSRITQTTIQRQVLQMGKLSAPVDDGPKPEEQTRDNKGDIDMRLYDKLTPEEQNKIYERICERYGLESGRRYLLVRSVTASDDKIETWTTECPPQRKKKVNQENVSCPPNKPKQHDVKCLDKSDSVTKKMETLVNVTQQCTTEQKTSKRKWKDNLKQQKPHRLGHVGFHVSIKGDSEFSFVSEETHSDRTPCGCGLFRCDCARSTERCDIPKTTKKCDLIKNDPDETNNFLITCRENLQDHKLQERRATVLQMHAVKSANRVTRESVYLQSSHDRVKTELETCLMKVMPPQGQEVSEIGQSHVEELANVFAEHRMVNEHEWRAWRHAQAKLENVENSEEIDSFDSDIMSSGDSDGQMSECDLWLSSVAHPSRIPYYKETLDLANTLFEKLNAKMEKVISKNHTKEMVRAKRPTTHAILEKINLLKGSRKNIFSQIIKCYKSINLYPKSLTPFSERRRRKHERAVSMKKDLLRKQKFRERIEGIQLGKQYKKPKRSFLFTKLENYRGFSPRRRKLLQDTGDGKFAKCDLVGRDLSGRVLNQKVMHKDYRLIRIMFDDEANRTSLLDPGMMARMKEYLGSFQRVENLGEEDEAEEGVTRSEIPSEYSDVTDQRRPKKDEQKTQTAMPPSRSYSSRNSGNAAAAITSMIRSLRSEAESFAGFTSTKTPSVSDVDPYPWSQTARHSSVSSRGAGSEKSRITKFAKDDRSKSHHVPSSRQNSTLKCSQSLGSNMAKSTSVPKSDPPKRDTQKWTTLAKPSKTLPPLHSTPKSANSFPQNYRCKSSKTVW